VLFQKAPAMRAPFFCFRVWVERRMGPFSKVPGLPGSSLASHIRFSTTWRMLLTRFRRLGGLKIVTRETQARALVEHNRVDDSNDAASWQFLECLRASEMALTRVYRAIQWPSPSASQPRSLGNCRSIRQLAVE